MFACYSFSFKDALKNSAILAVVNLPAALFTSAFTIGIFCLAHANTAFHYIILIVLFTLGFVLLGGIWTSASQKSFHNYIAPQFESERTGGRVRPEARRGVNPYKAQRENAKAKEGTAIGQATRMRAENGKTDRQNNSEEKKKKQQTKHVSYKRKK